MKKITIISILLNLVLVTICVLEYSKITASKQNIEIFQKEKKVYDKESQLKKDIDKKDPLYIFNSKKFPCDSGSTSYESNLCIGEKLKFADSLLNELVKNKFLILNKYIKMDKEGIIKAKGDVFFTNALKINASKKENLIKYQNLWEQMRLLNSENVRLECDGATGCSGIVSKAEINYILERIEEIKKINGYN